jgi:hypothetical protein
LHPGPNGHAPPPRAAPLRHRQQILQSGPAIARLRDNQRFGQRAGGNQQTIIGFERSHAGWPRLFVQHNGHECRGIDGNHFGRPFSS